MGTSAASWSDDVLAWGVQFLCVWLAGLVLGWLLPKPKWVERGLRAKALLLSSPPGLWFRRVALAAHLSLIVREVWRNLFVPGTFRGVLRNLWRTLTTGARFEWPHPATAAAAPAPTNAAAATTEDAWYVGDKDLAEFKWTLEGGRPAGASDWELMMQKQWPGCTYTAWRRTIAGGKSEYKSVTISEDATAEEFMDFYLDDQTRMTWDSMISETQLLESGSGEGGAARRQQVVRWLRTFPFAFISQREYIIARSFFRDPSDGSLYAVTKGLVEHPAAPALPGVVRMEGFHSHWRSRTVPCPHGSGRPAVETVLLHFEDFRINERLARFSVRHGMSGFVKGMIPAVQRFVAERRLRCSPEQEDVISFGRRQLAPAALHATREAGGISAHLLPRCGSLQSTTSYGSESGYSMDDTASERSAGRGSCAGSGTSAGSMARSSSMRRLGAMMLASGVAIALARTASTGSLASPGGGAGSGAGRHSSGSSQQHGKRHGHSHGSHHHSHKQQHHGGSRRHYEAGPPRPRRRQQQDLAALDPAVQAALVQA